MPHAGRIELSNLSILLQESCRVVWTRIGGRTIALDAITEILAGKLDAMPKHVRISLPSTCSADIDPLRVAAGTPPEAATPPGPIAPPSGIPSAAVTEAESLRGSPRWGMSSLGSVRSSRLF